MQSPTDVLVVLTEIDVGLSKDQYMIKRQTHRTGSAGRKDGKDRGPPGFDPVDALRQSG